MAVELSVANTALALIGAAVAWLFKSSIQYGKDIAVLQNTIEYYIKKSVAGAAVVLDSPNPAPMEIRILLRKQVNGDLDDPAERDKLVAYLAQVIDDPNSPKSEKSAAFTMLNGMEAAKLLNPPKRSYWWPFGKSQ